MKIGKFEMRRDQNAPRNINYYWGNTWLITSSPRYVILAFSPTGSRNYQGILNLGFAGRWGMWRKGRFYPLLPAKLRKAIR